MRVIKFVLPLLVLLLISGCSIFGAVESKPPIIPSDPVDVIIQTIEKTNWIVTLGILGVGAGFFAFLNGSSKGLQAMAACLVVISLTLGVMRYSMWIAAIAAVGSISLVLYSILAKNKAIKEIVTGVQDLKSKIYYAEVNPSTLLGGKQSPSTEAIVKTVKNKLNSI